MNPRHPIRTGVSRRTSLADTGLGFTGLALSTMLFRAGRARAAEPISDLKSEISNLSPRAKSVIWIFLCGGVSHVESFDIKPALIKYAGKSISDTPYASVLDPA